MINISFKSINKSKKIIPLPNRLSLLASKICGLVYKNLELNFSDRESQKLVIERHFALSEKLKLRLILYGRGNKGDLLALVMKN